MQGYSQSRQYYFERLVKKYVENPVYIVSKSKMKEAIYIEWESCSKCYLMKPHAKKRAEENWYEFQSFRFDDISVREFDIQAIPMLILKEEWEVKQIYNEEWIVNLISNK